MSDEPDLRDLPSLKRWGDRLRDATEREEQRKTRRGFPVRRFAVAVAVMLAAVPGAVGTRSIWLEPIDRVDPGSDPKRTPAVVLAEGHAGGIDWRLGGYDRGDGWRCVQLQSSATDAPVGGGCSELSAGAAEIVVASDTQGGFGFVFGTVAPDVADVTVTVAGGRAARVPAEAPDRDSLRRSGLPRLRTFVAVFQKGFADISPPTVVARDARGHVLGRSGGGAP